MSAFVLPSRITLADATGVFSGLEAHLQEARGDAAWVLDASALQEFDTAAVSVLMAAERLATERGMACQVLKAPEKLRRLAQLYGVDELLSWG